MSAFAQALGSTASLSDKAGLTGTGTYLLTGTGDHMGQSGQPCLQLTWRMRQAVSPALCGRNTGPTSPCPITPAPVAVTACVQHYMGHPQLFRCWRCASSSTT